MRSCASCPVLPEMVEPMKGDASRVVEDALLVHLDEALAASHRAVFDALDEAFCVIEVIFDEGGGPVDYRFVVVNEAYEDHTGFSDVVGKTIREVLPSVDRSGIETFAQVARAREPVRFVHESQPLHRWYDVYAWPLGRPGNDRVAVHFTDITDRKHADDELRYRSEQFQALVQQAPIGVYLIDADFCVAEVNPAARPSFGDIRDLIGRDYEEVVRILWPNEVADEVLRIARHTLATGISHHEPEMSGVRADRGNTEYYDWRMDRIRLPNGRDGLVCYFADISSQVLARHELAVSENRYRTLFESIDEGFCILEMIFEENERVVDYRFVELNPAFERHTGLSGAVGHTIKELVPVIEPLWFETYGEVALTGKSTRFVDHGESLNRWFDVFAFRVGDPEERKVGVLFNDITERKRAEHALQESVALLRHHAHHDALTGLPNRVLFEDRLRLAVAAAERHGRPFTVLFLDLDDFKAINDDLGHESGDVVLIEVARRLRRSLRASDTLARIHGDEFVVILPELAEPQEVGTLIEKLLAVVDDPIDVAGTTVSLRVSIGHSAYPEDGANPSELLRASDASMYRAKLVGKSAARQVLVEPTREDRRREPS